MAATRSTQPLDLSPESADLHQAFGLFRSRLESIPVPRSVAALRLSDEEVKWLRVWFEARDKRSFRSWLATELPTAGSASPRAMLGLLFLIYAAETIRESATEDALWPSVATIWPPALRSFLPQGQPSQTLKRSLDAAARRFEMRHLLDKGDGRQYFDTVKLQFGFTYLGARARLHEWLVGLGVPVAVTILIEEDERFSTLRSTSFRSTWETFKRYRKGQLSRADAKQRLLASHWIRSHWVESLLNTSCTPVRRMEGASSPVVKQHGIVTRVGLRWPPGKAPVLRLELKRQEVVESVTAAHQIRVAIDQKIVAVWLRQADGSWSGVDTIEIENLRPMSLTIATGEGELLDEVNLTELETHQDVALFDLNSDSLLADTDTPIRTTIEHALLVDADLEVANLPGAEWRRVGDCKLYRLSPPWPPTVAVLLDELEFWTPQTTEQRAQEKLTLHLTTEDGRPAAVGSHDELAVLGVPDDAEKVVLLLGEQQLPLEKKHSAWITADSVEFSPKLLLRLLKHRVRIWRPGSTRTYPAKIAIESTGSLVCEPDLHTGGPPQWRQLRASDPLNIAAGTAQIRLLGIQNSRTVLFEGDRAVGSLLKRGTSLSKLDFHGWGAPLYAENENGRRDLASTVLDRGCIYLFLGELFKGRQMDTSPILHLRTPVEASDGHAIVVWLHDRQNPTRLQDLTSNDVAVEADGTLWRLKNLPKINALSLSYRGTNLGAWWDTRAIASALRSDRSMRMFALLRWFKVPVLGRDLKYITTGAIHKAPLPFLSAWLGGEGLPAKLQHRPIDAGVEAVIRNFLWDWAGRPHLVHDMLSLFASTASATPDAVDAGLVGGARICPTLLWAAEAAIPTADARAAHAFLHESVLNYSSFSSEIDRAELRSQIQDGRFDKNLETTAYRRLGETELHRLEMATLILERMVELGEKGRGY